MIVLMSPTRSARSTCGALAMALRGKSARAAKSRLATRSADPARMQRVCDGRRCKTWNISPSPRSGERVGGRGGEEKAIADARENRRSMGEEPFVDAIHASDAVLRDL